jgi:hypothetical protein
MALNLRTITGIILLGLTYAVYKNPITVKNIILRLLGRRIIEPRIDRYSIALDMLKLIIGSESSIDLIKHQVEETLRELGEIE